MKTLVLTFALTVVAAAVTAAACGYVAVTVTAAANAAPERMTGQQLQDAFETAIQSQKADNVLRMLTDEIRSEIDEPVLQRLLEQINTNLGPARSRTQTGLRSIVDSKRHIIESVAEVTFENGEATIELNSVDGKLIGFNVSSKKLINWLDRPSSNALYERMGSEFIRTLMLGNVDTAFEMMYPMLQKQLGKDDFAAMVEVTRGTIDADNDLTITVNNSRMLETNEDSAPTMLIDFDLRNGDVTGTCEIKIQFVGMRGHLLGFHFNK